MKIEKNIMSSHILPVIIHIETATDICSVALAKGEQLLAHKERRNDYSHAENLILFIQEVIAEQGYQPQELSAICVSAGPGSYTGLRIGVATAKGLSYSLNIPLIAISTIESIFWGAKDRFPTHNGFFCPMLDARRMEVYTALFDSQGEEIKPVHAAIVDENTFQDELKEHRILFCGNGAEKCKFLLENSKNALFDFTPLAAKNMIKIATKKYKNQQFENIAYFDPFYVKNYIPGKPTVKGLYEDMSRKKNEKRA